MTKNELLRWKRCTDAAGFAADARTAVEEVGKELSDKGFKRLGRLAAGATLDGQPLLGCLFTVFLDRQAREDDQLFRALNLKSQKGGLVLPAELKRNLDGLAVGMRELGGSLEQHLEILLLRMEEASTSSLARIEREVAKLVARLPPGPPSLRDNDTIPDKQWDGVAQVLKEWRQIPEAMWEKNPKLLVKLARIFMGAGDFNEALEAFRDLARSEKENGPKAEAHHGAYLAALEKDDRKEALEQLKEAIGLCPERFRLFDDNRFEPREIVGIGGYGTVFRCRDTTTGDEVAVKALHAERSQFGVEGPFKEVLASRAINHPAVVRVHDCGYADPGKKERPYVFMEHFSGESLEELLRREHKLTLADFLDVGKQVAEGMAAAHKANVLHRDLKPGNLLVRREGSRWRVKIVDLGSALRLDALRIGRPTGAPKTMLGRSIAGTRGYAAPEQTGELKGVGPGNYSDIYSFGRLCCRCLFGSPERPGRSDWDKLPNRIADLIDRCLRSDHRERPSGFGEVVEILADAKGANLQSWIATGELDRWIAERNGGWSKEDWRGLLDRLKRSVHWPLDEEALGAEVETARRLFCQQRQSRQDGENIQRWLATGSPRDWVEERRKGGLPYEAEAFSGLLRSSGVASRNPDLVRRLVDELWRTWEPAGFRTSNSLGRSLAWIPPGSFRMGSPPGERDRGQGEDARQVRITRGYFIGVDPVTQEEYRQVMNASPSRFSGGDLPVHNVSWDEAVEYCRRLSEREQRRYRLPTEAEWERACRAGTDTAYSFGNDHRGGFLYFRFILAEHGHYTPYDDVGRMLLSLILRQPSRCGCKKANPWGLNDMHGNMWEWCSDWFGAASGGVAVVDPQGPASGSARVVKGGGFRSGAQDLRSAARQSNMPADEVGFRVVLEYDDLWGRSDADALRAAGVITG